MEVTVSVCACTRKNGADNKFPERIEDFITNISPIITVDTSPAWTAATAHPATPNSYYEAGVIFTI